MSDQARAAQFLQDGLNHWRANALHEALECFTSAAEADPYFPDAYFYKGLCLRRLGHFDLAIRAFSEALNLDANLLKAYVGRAYAYLDKQNQVFSALAVQDFETLLARGGAQQLATSKEFHNLERMMSVLKPMLELSGHYPPREDGLQPDDFVPVSGDRDEATRLVMEAQRLMHDGDLSAAFENLNQALYVDEDNESAHYERGVVWLSRREWQLAVQDFSETIRIMPNFADAYAKRGLALTMLERIPEALGDYDTAIALQPDSDTFYASRGMVYHRMNDLGAAARDFVTALQFNPQNALVYFHLGLVFNTQGNYAGALEAYDQALRLDSTLGDAYVARAIILGSLGRFEESIADLETYLRSGTGEISYEHARRLLTAMQKKRADS